MWNKRIVISKHVRERFEQRHIKFYKSTDSIEKQIRMDLRPLNVRRKEKLNDLEYKVVTKQGKVYIIKEIPNENKIIVKTVYKIDIKKEMLNIEEL